ncbi:hypothetical protein Plhal304r1_c024g0081421 [Plasmopara halstedii]
MAGATVFRAQLVMEDPLNGLKLKHSKRHGQLTLDTTTQSAQLVYPRVGRFFQRRFEQPLKCVMGRKLVRVYSSNGKKHFTCRLLSEQDAAKCSETLRSFGVEVIIVGELMLEADQCGQNTQDAVIAGKAALLALREASPRSMLTEIREYEESTQLREDTEIIMRSLFDMHS